MDHRQRHVLAADEFSEFLRVGQRNIAQARVERGAAVAGGDIDDLDALGLCQLPGQGMFAAT